MNIDKFKEQHAQILQQVQALRELAHAGVATHAPEISRTILGMTSTIKLHLAAEDRALYPALQKGHDAELARMGQKLQDEMGSLAETYVGFATHWSKVEHLRSDEQGFKSAANLVLRALHERVQLENRDFYPRIEAL